MRSAQSPSIDFNQMLVISVFFHFFLFTVFMFLPQTQETVKRIIPTFTVNFVDIPTGPDIQSAPPAKETPVAEKAIPPEPKPIPQKPKPIPEPITKSIPEPKLKPKPIPVPEKPVPSKALSKLDELARLQNKKKIPKKDKLAMAVPKPKPSALENFENMKMKTAAEKKTKPTRKKIAKNDLTLEEIEFEQLSKRSAANQPKTKSPKTSSLLKELNELEQMNKQAHAALNKPKVKQTDPKSNDLLKQLEAIKKESVQIKIDTSKLSSRHSQKFKSEIHNLKMAEIQRKIARPAASGETGDPAADALSKYVGEVYIRVFKNWKDPLGGGNGRVEVSFTIFPKGNIAMPKIVKSSGVSKLDSLAIRAIKNAVPLPPFPKEIKEPNLPLTFEFTYVPKKS
jgi:TolA protein